MAITKNGVRLRTYGTTGDGVEIAQPERGMGYSYETTYTEDSGRVQSGTAIVAPMFTVKSYSYSRTHPTVAQVAQILSFIVGGGKYEMYAFNPKTGTWGWDVYYTGKGDMSIGYLTPDGGHYDSFSFNAVGVKPI
nr:MAG TPA: hypothetical protein [Caudoviricetes sp.]